MKTLDSVDYVMEDLSQRLVQQSLTVNYSQNQGDTSIIVKFKSLKEIKAIVKALVLKNNCE